MDNSEELQKVNEKLKGALEKQAETIQSATDDLISGIDSDNSKFVNELESIKANILSSIQTATGGGNLELDLDKTVSLEALLGDSSKVEGSVKFVKKLQSIKANILKSVGKSTAGGNLELDLDKNISLGGLLGDTSKNELDTAKFGDELDQIKSGILASVSKETNGGKMDLDIDKSISLSELMGDTKKLDNLNMVLAFGFLRVKKNILKSVETATKGGNLELDIDPSMKLSELLGESPNLNLVHAFRWLRIKKNILKKVEAATEEVELEIDPKMSLNDVLGATPDQDILTKTRFFLIRQRLLNKISKAAKDFDPQQTVDEITGGFGGAPAASAEGAPAAAPTEGATAGAVSSVIPPDAIEAITNTSSSLETLVESSEGDVLQDRENRKEDIKRETKRTSALSNLTGGKNIITAGKEKAGGMINSLKDGIKSRLGFGGGGTRRAGGGAGKAAGGGVGGAIAGIGKGAGEGISGFMKGLGKGLKALADKKYLISAAVLIALGGALFVTGKALKEFVGLDFKSIAIGVVTLGALAVMAKLIGKAAKEIFIGSLAIAALGASLIPAGFAFGMFSDINWAGVGIGIGVLVALGAAAFGLSFIAPAIFIGAAAIAVLGAALIPAAFAFDIFGTALEKITPFFTVFAEAIKTVIGAVGDFLTNFVESLSKLGDAGPGLLIAAAGIAAVSAALIAFGAASAVGGVLNFFSGDPVKKFIELGKVAPDLATASDSIDKLSDSIQSFDTGEPDKLEEFVDQIKRLSKLKLKTVAKVMQHISEISGAASAPANVLPAGSAIGQPASPQLEQKNTPVASGSKEIKDSGPVTKEYIEASLALDKTSDSLAKFEADKSKSFKMVEEEVDDDMDWHVPAMLKVYDNEEDQAKFLELKKSNSDAETAVRDEKDKIIGSDAQFGSTEMMLDKLKFAKENFSHGQLLSMINKEGKYELGIQSENGGIDANIDAFLEAQVDKVRIEQMEASKPVKTIPDQMGDIANSAAAPAKAIPSMKSAVPSLEQKNTPRSGDIKDDGLATKEYIEAKIRYDKAYEALENFENDPKKKFKMEQVYDDTFDEYNDERVYDNKEDQAMFEKLKSDNYNAEFDAQAEEDKIVGIDSGDAFSQINLKRSQFLDANVDESKRKWIGDSPMANNINIEAFLQEAVDRAKNKQMEASKPQSNSVEQIEKQSGNQLDMASRQNEADKNASKGADGNTLNNVVNNKEGDTTQVSNTTINAQPHIDRTADFLAPAF